MFSGNSVFQKIGGGGVNPVSVTQLHSMNPEPHIAFKSKIRLPKKQCYFKLQLDNLQNESSSPRRNRQPRLSPRAGPYCSSPWSRGFDSLSFCEWHSSWSLLTIEREKKTSRLPWDSRILRIDPDFQIETRGPFYRTPPLFVSCYCYRRRNFFGFDKKCPCQVWDRGYRWCSRQPSGARTRIPYAKSILLLFPPLLEFRNRDWLTMPDCKSCDGCSYRSREREGGGRRKGIESVDLLRDGGVEVWRGYGLEVGWFVCLPLPVYPSDGLGEIKSLGN